MCVYVCLRECARAWVRACVRVYVRGGGGGVVSIILQGTTSCSFQVRLVQRRAVSGKVLPGVTTEILWGVQGWGGGVGVWRWGEKRETIPNATLSPPEC